MKVQTKILVNFSGEEDLCYGCIVREVPNHQIFSVAYFISGPHTLQSSELDHAKVLLLDPALGFFDRSIMFAPFLTISAGAVRTNTK